MYYKSLLETLKDEGDNRIRVEDEFSSNDEYRAEITLIPKDLNICPSCNSTNVIKFGKKETQNCVSLQSKLSSLAHDFSSKTAMFLTGRHVA